MAAKTLMILGSMSSAGKDLLVTALRRIDAGFSPSVHMNPLLIKPAGDSHSQVIRMGWPWHALQAKTCYAKNSLMGCPGPPA